MLSSASIPWTVPAELAGMDYSVLKTRHFARLILALSIEYGCTAPLLFVPGVKSYTGFYVEFQQTIGQMIHIQGHGR